MRVTKTQSPAPPPPPYNINAVFSEVEAEKFVTELRQLLNRDFLPPVFLLHVLQVVDGTRCSPPEEA